jgi:hypothetical protein
MILDAFSGDAIPIHLITREAIALYFSKLTGDGNIALHISNRALDLEPVVANIAADLGAAALGQFYRPDDNIRARHFAEASQWILLARRPEQLSMLDDDPRWTQLHAVPGYGLWTDDFSNILEIYRWP